MSGNPLRVLVVEDSESDAELLLRELRRGGYDVTHRRVDTAKTMRDALVTEPWDVILSDFNLPDFDAVGALRTLAATDLDVPFIIVSGTIGEETAVAALHAGAGDFLLKGKLARLIPAIERGLRNRRDRDAHREAQRALLLSEQRYRQIVETTNEGVWLVDPGGKVTFVNRRVVDLLGHPEHEILGTKLTDLLSESARAPFERELARRGDVTSTQIETRFRRHDGSELWVLLEVTSRRGSSNRDEGALLMMRDVSQRKGLEDQLRQAQKMEAIGRLAGGVAHDFNNLLSVILSLSSMIVSSLKPGDPIRSDLEEVRRAGERAADLTRQLLAFSRQQVLEPRTIDLNQIIVGMDKMLRRLLGEEVELSLLTAHRLGYVNADAGQIEQILMNLLVNARDAMPLGGKVAIETGNVHLDAAYAATHHEVVPGDYVMLAVTDTGTGMDAATQAHIFEPFFTTKEQGKGTGLGLSTVLGIVKQSGGHVWLYSEPGKGTTFKIYLPRIDAEPEAARRATAPPPTLHGRETVLVVEDEDQVRAVTRAILRRYGYNVLEAQNGGEAFLICEKYPAKIHLLLTDVVMPRMSGRELAERLAPMRPEMRVLYVSGYTENSVVHHGVLDAGVAFLQKPITPEALGRKVRDVLNAPKR
jgi:PAS domain S-box-containing protein